MQRKTAPTTSRPKPLKVLRRETTRAKAEMAQAKASAELMMWQHVNNSYKGGLSDRMSEMWGVSQGMRFGTEHDRRLLGSARDRAYEAYKNNPVARTLVQTETDHVIGDGANYQPTSDSEAWNREAVDKYYEWIDRCSVRGGDVLSGCELQRALWSQSRVAGSIGWLLVARGMESRIQIVPAENLVTPDGLHAEKGIYDGIKFDPTGAPTAFYILYHDERGERRFESVAARDFVWFPHMSRPDQPGGETCFLTIFDLLAHLDRYIDGVSLAAWMATVFGIIFKQNNASKQLAGLPTLANSQGVQQRAVTFENGLVKYVGTDEDVAQVQASQPMQQTPEFIRTMFRMLGQPFDMPLEVIAKDMSTCNFASARIGLLPFYRTCRIKFARFGTRWSRTIRWWLSRERLRADDDPKKWNTAFPENYWSHELLPNAFEYTDPVSDAQSDHLQLDMRTKSPQMVLQERGRDGKKILRDWEEWNTLMETAKLAQFHSTMSRDEAPPVQENPESKPNENKSEENDDAA